MRPVRGQPHVQLQGVPGVPGAVQQTGAEKVEQETEPFRSRLPTGGLPSDRPEPVTGRGHVLELPIPISSGRLQQLLYDFRTNADPVIIYSIPFNFVYMTPRQACQTHSLQL